MKASLTSMRDLYGAAYTFFVTRRRASIFDFFCCGGWVGVAGGAEVGVEVGVEVLFRFEVDELGENEGVDNVGAEESEGIYDGGFANESVDAVVAEDGTTTTLSSPPIP